MGMEGSSGFGKLGFKDIIVESLNLTNGLKWPIFRRFCFVVCIGFLLWILQMLYLFTHMIHGTDVDKSLNVITTIILSLLCLVLWSPVFMMGVRKSIGLPVSLRLIKSECLKVKGNLFGLLLIYVFFSVIINYLILPDGRSYLTGYFAITCYKAIMYVLSLPMIFFSFPLIIMQKKSVYCAVVSAYKKMRVCWKEFSGSFLLITYIPILIAAGLLLAVNQSGVKILYLPVIILFLIAQVWLFPMTFTLGGVLFREAYGLKKVVRDSR